MAGYRRYTAWSPFQRVLYDLMSWRQVGASNTFAFWQHSAVLIAVLIAAHA